jgi:RNA-dependent RNA polymerase
VCRFATLLDSSKNGCRLKEGLLRRDLHTYGSKSSVPYNIGVEGRDILTILKSAGLKKGNELQKKYRDLGQIDKWIANDEALRAPVINADRTARKYSARGFKDYLDEFVSIQHHVHAAYEEYQRTLGVYFARKSEKSKSVKKSRRDKQEDLFLQCAKLFAEVIPGIDLIQNVEEVKASCAYDKNPKFAFQVAFRRLCLLKGESKPGGLVPSLRIFDEAKKVSPSFLKALEWTDEDHLESAPLE